MKAHFVTFYSPGTFCSEATTKPIASWDTAKACEMAHEITERHGATPYSFVFTTRERGDSDLDSKVTKTSGRYFLGGRVMTLAGVKREMPKDRILIDNMRINNIARVVVNTNSYRSVNPLEAGDTVLEWKPRNKRRRASAG